MVEHDFIMATYLADRVIVFEGEPSISTEANSPQVSPPAVRHHPGHTLEGCAAGHCPGHTLEGCAAGHRPGHTLEGCAAGHHPGHTLEGCAAGRGGAPRQTVTAMTAKLLVFMSGLGPLDMALAHFADFFCT